MRIAFALLLAVVSFGASIPTGAAVGGGLLALAVVLAGAAVNLRYTVLVADAQPRPAMFYIREASIPVGPADELFPGTAHVPAVPNVPAQREDSEAKP